jgi:hypothetical protein
MISENAIIANLAYSICRRQMIQLLLAGDQANAVQNCWRASSGWRGPDGLRDGPKRISRG